MEIGREKVKNLSFVLSNRHTTTFEDRPIPKLKNSYDVLIRIKFTGVCGSDVHFWEHGSLGLFVVESPIVLGHESAGTVAKIGSSVTSLKAGDNVTIEPGVPCRRCPRCKEGRYNLCGEMAFAATPPYDGTLTGYYIVPEDFCYLLPATVTMQEGSLVEPLAVAIHVMKQARLQHGDSVVIFGAGAVGLLCCAVAKVFGAGKIISVDIQESRLKFAKSFAATAIYMPQRISSKENAKDLIQKNDLGKGADVAVDASGAESSIQTAIHVLRMGGTYVQAGMGKNEVNFPIMAVSVKELNIKGSFRYSSGDYALALELVGAGKIDVKQLITRVVRFEDAELAFKDVKGGQGIKILIAGPEE